MTRQSDVKQNTSNMGCKTVRIKKETQRRRPKTHRLDTAAGINREAKYETQGEEQGTTGETKHRDTTKTQSRQKEIQTWRHKTHGGARDKCKHTGRRQTHKRNLRE